MEALTWRQTDWFRLAFGGWGACMPCDYYKAALMRHSKLVDRRLGWPEWDEDEDTTPE